MEEESKKYGWTDYRGMSPYLFAHITDTKTNETVIGLMTSKSISVNSEYMSKFEEDNADEKLPFTAILQTGGIEKVTGLDFASVFEGRTHYTKQQSLQVWTSISPLEISLEVAFRATKDAFTEVTLPIQKLRQFLSPILKESLTEAHKKQIEETIKKKDKKGITEYLEGVLGHVPNRIALGFLGNFFNEKYRLLSVSESVDKVRIDKFGNQVYQTVSLEFRSDRSLNKEDYFTTPKSIQENKNKL